MILFPTFSSATRLEAMSESRVELKCSLYNVHHEIDMDRFTVEWIARKYQPGNKLASGLFDFLFSSVQWARIFKKSLGAGQKKTREIK